MSKQGPGKPAWPSRVGRAALLTLIVMIANYGWWTGRNVVRETLAVALAFANSLVVVSIFDLTRRWLRSRHRH